MTGKKKNNSDETQQETLEGKQRLMEEIVNNAREEAESIIAQAEKTKEQKLASAEGKAKRTVRDAEDRAADKIRQIEGRNQSSIQIKKKRIQLQQSEEIIRYIFEQVEGRIKEQVGTNEYIETLKKWVVEAVLGVAAKEVVIAVSEKEKPYIKPGFLEEVRELVKKAGGGDIRLTVSEEPENDYGVCVRSADGRLEYRNQITTRLKRNQNDYRKRVYTALEIEGV